MISIVTLAVLLAQQVSAPASAPAAPVAPPRVEGRVVNALTGDPVRKATVVLRANDERGASYADETDSSGHFSMSDVEPGEYAVFAEHSNFFMRASGATGAPPPNIRVEKGQPVPAFTIQLTPPGAITGRVLDSDGDPVRGASVNALRYMYSNGHRRLANFEQVQTNDNGDYRLFGLRAGTLYLKATHYRQKTGGPTETITSYYPGAPDESHASPVVLRAGAQLSGFDIRMQASGAYTVRAHFLEPEDQVTRIPVFLLSDQGFTPGQEVSISSGGVVFTAVPPGSYEVVAIRQAEGEKPAYARLPVEVVNADVDGGALSFLPAADIAGSIRVEGGPFSGFERMRVNLQPAHGGPMIGGLSSEVKPDGSFLVKNAPPAVFDVTVNRTPGVYLKSVRMGDKVLAGRRVDLTLKPEALTIVLGADMGLVEGSVANAKGDPVVRARVTVIPYGDHSGRIDLARTGFSDEKGEFKIKNVAPGDFKVFAWEDVPVGAPQDPDFRKPFEKQAVNLRIQPSGHEKVSVTSIPAAATKSDDQ